MPVRVRQVSTSYRQLEDIKLDATRLVRAGLPDADLIYEAAPDWEQNRVVLTLSRYSDRLITALATRYGSNAVAVRVEPRSDVVPLSRDADYSPFFGGAIINTGSEGCTSGFPWHDATTNYMLTAGHCAPNGATSVRTTDANFNTIDWMATSNAIASGSGENWSSGVGTVLLPGDSTYRGDIAIIRISSSKSIDPYIYSGPNTYNAASVHNMWTTVPVPGEQYCTGGSNTYALCGWGVSLVRINYFYASKNEWALNVTKGLKNFGTSGNGGDSGGPVYTVNGDGTIAAKGLISGGTTGPSSCSELSKCTNIFTDILLPYYGFPGWLYTQ